MDQPTSPSQPNSGPRPAEVVEDSVKKDIEMNKDIAAFGYLWIMCFVVYFLRRNSPFVRFHAKQSMVLFAISIVVALIPMINRVLELGVLCLMVWGFVNAAQGQWKDIPIVGPLSRGQISLRQAWAQLVEYVARLARALRSTKTQDPKRASSATASSTASNKPVPTVIELPSKTPPSA